MSTITEHTLASVLTVTVETIHMNSGNSARVTATSVEAALMQGIKLVNIDQAPVQHVFARIAEHLTTETPAWFSGIYARII